MTTKQTASKIIHKEIQTFVSELGNLTNEQIANFADKRSVNENTASSVRAMIKKIMEPFAERMLRNSLPRAKKKKSTEEAAS